MGKRLKKMMMDELVQDFHNVSECVFVDFRGITAENFNQLRNTLRENGAKLKVLNNSLAKQALERLEVKGLDEIFLGPTAIIFGEIDTPSISKRVEEWRKKNGIIEMKGGLLNKKIISKEDVQRLAKLPTREELLTSVAVLFAAPLTEVLTLLNSTFSQIASLINSHIIKLEKGES